MCRAVTCLSYCIAVTTKSLLFAADAQSTLEPTLRFLDLVSLRIRRGTLHIDGEGAASTSAMSRVPAEVWDVVRYELIDIDMRRAGQRLAKGWLCDSCIDFVPGSQLVWDNSRPACDACCDLKADFAGINGYKRASLIQRVLLHPLGFCLPTPYPVRVNTSHDISEPPLKTDSRTATFIAIKAALGDRDEQQVLDVSPQVPNDATRRFEMLVTRYHLQPVQVTDGTISHTDTTKAEQYATLGQGRRVFRLTTAVRPRWKLFSTHRMCRATTHIFFGLPIRTWSLVPAADAWPELVKTLPFFDLITLRILNGIFQATKRGGGSSVVERVPIEVWDVVKHKLVDVELQEANDRIMRDLEVNDWSCWGSGLRKPGKSLAGSALPPFWTDICSEADPCDMCSEPLFYWLMDLRDDEHSKLRALLRHFSMFLVSARPLTCDDSDAVDLYSAMHIALLPSDGNLTPICVDCGGDMDPDQQTVQELDPASMLTIARDGRRRFSRLIRLLHLEPLSIKTLPDTERLAGEGDDYIPRKRVFTDVAINEIQPKWTVHSICKMLW
ncbi:hypothetical protein JCM10049v2_001122 [Rhodotorula toruloides]